LRSKRWIKRAIKHKGSLRRWAKKHKLMKKGKILLGKAYDYAKKKKLKRRMKQVVLAKTLKRLRKK